MAMAPFAESSEPDGRGTRRRPRGRDFASTAAERLSQSKPTTEVRVRCAVEALAHEYPRVSAVAVTSMSGQSFAEALERAIARSTKPPPKVIEAQLVEPLPASELKGPMPHYRNNFRRY
jgi:hypothetical protein